MKIKIALILALSAIVFILIPVCDNILNYSGERTNVQMLIDYWHLYLCVLVFLVSSRWLAK